MDIVESAVLSLIVPEIVLHRDDVKYDALVLLG